MTDEKLRTGNATSLCYRLDSDSKNDILYEYVDRLTL